MIKSFIVAYLQSHAYAKRVDLLTYLHQNGLYPSDRVMRAMVEELVMVDGLCIGSTEYGYRLISNQTQLEDAVEYLRKKAKPIAIRANQLISNYQKQHKTQLQITF